jgi:hypothetical protein
LEAQVSAAQPVFFAYSWQLPAPSHLPFVMQLAVPASWQVARGSALPAVTIVHFPSEPASAQLRQPPAHALSQQTPSTHCPDLHSLPLPQGCPFCFGPQLPLTQLIPTSQSASLWQVPVQAPVTQRNGEQSCRAGARQLPSPSQVAAVLSLLLAQAGARQTVPSA